MPTVGSLAWSLIADNSRFRSGTAGARKDAAELRGGLLGLKDAGSALTGTMASLGLALSGAALIGGMKALISDSFGAIDRTAKLSDRLGVATERLTGLQHAAKLAGVETEGFNDSFEKIVRRLGDLTVRGEDAGDTLERFGLDARKLAMSSPDEALLQVADAFRRMENPAMRAALATQLGIGKNSEMISVLMQGREALEANIKEAEELGMTFSRVEATQIEEANDAWDRMKGAVKGVSNELAIGLAPAIEGIADKLAGVLKTLNDPKFGRALVNFLETPLGADKPFLPDPVGVPDEVKQRAFQKLRAQFPNAPASELMARINSAPEGARGGTVGDLIDPEVSEKARQAAERREEQIRRQQIDAIKNRMEAESKMLDELAERANKIFDAVQTPAERLGDEFRELVAMRPHLADDTFNRALTDIKLRASDIADRGIAGTQSTAAVRAGSVEALRAQFSGAKPTSEKQLEEQRKQREEQEEANGLLSDIRDELRTARLLEAPD